MARPANILSWIGLLAIGGFTLAAISDMMGVRLATGETYPPYSSRRAEPDGTRALYEALNRLPGVSCERNYQPVKRLQANPGDVLIIADIAGGKVQSHCGCVEDGKTLTQWASNGGRVILALRPGRATFGSIAPSARRHQDLPSEKDGKEEEEEEPSSPKKKKMEAEDMRYLGCAFGLFLHERPFSLQPDFLPRRPQPATGLSLKQDELPRWFSNSFLEPAPDVEDQWITLATKGTRPVIMERKIGKGSLVVCTDSFFLSNEALWREANPAFLAHLMGDANRVVFEERTHGVGENDGIMTLARRYGMHGLFIGGIVLFILFIWRNAVSLVPTDHDSDLGLWRGDSVAGQGAASGLVSILKRGIKPGQLLEKCFADWEITRPATARIPADRIEKAREILVEIKQGKQPLRQIRTAYKRICEALHPSKF